MPRLPTALALALIAAAPTHAWTPPRGYCLLGTPETSMIVQAAGLVSPLDLLPERISAPCAAVADAHANGRTVLTQVPLVVFGRPAILEPGSVPMRPEEIRLWAALFRPNAEESLADAWPEASEAVLATWRRMMARGDGAALAAHLEARAATTPPTGPYAIILSEGDAEMRFFVENPTAGLRMIVRVHLNGGRMAWSVIVVPGLPHPHPLPDLLALADAEAAANR